MYVLTDDYNEYPNTAEIIDEIKIADIITTNKKRRYYNLPSSFDIETSSFYVKGEKQACMFLWQFGINGRVVIGRTWTEFIDLINQIKEITTATLICYVHNLSYEFQFMRKYFEWKKVFALESRKVLYATTDNVEFRCSYLLSGYALSNLSSQLVKYKTQKLCGDLDYKKLRHSETELTRTEIGYAVRDVVVVMAYIQEKIEFDGNITKIPLTNTGYVRKFCRNQCMFDKNKKLSTIKMLNYQKMIKSLTITPSEYAQLKRAFQGGFTHASVLNVNHVWDDVASYDFISSYPAVMVAEKFPMCRGRVVSVPSKKDFERYLKSYCCMFDITFYNLECKVFFEHSLSKSKCWNVIGATVDNGRIVSAKQLSTTITEQDYDILNKMYSWSDYELGTFTIYKKSYLPTSFVKAILKLYADKTTLKDVDGAEREYQIKKGMLNSSYGMTVTDIVRDVIEYADEWQTIPPDVETLIDKYNGGFNRFLFYPWGVWVTAYARHNLFTGIFECKDDYIYSDTDSIKIINYQNHLSYINDYNKKIMDKINKALTFHGLPKDAARPRTIEGVEKPLGVWDFEGVYDKFKTLGAKRYLTLKDGAYKLTVAGVGKKSAIKYMLSKYDDVFKAFDNNLIIPAKYTDKNTHTYIDEYISGKITDYNGLTSRYAEMSAVHLEETAYTLSMSDDYIMFMLQIKRREK